METADAEFLAQLFLGEVLPRCKTLVTSLLAVGAGSLGVELGQKTACVFDMVAVAEPPGMPIPDVGPLEETNVVWGVCACTSKTGAPVRDAISVHTALLLQSLYSNLSDIMAMGFAHQFGLVLAPNLLLCSPSFPHGTSFDAFVEHLLLHLLAPEGCACVGVPASRGPLHTFLTAVSRSYFSSEALAAFISRSPGRLKARVVEHTAELRCKDAEEMAAVLRLHAECATAHDPSSDKQEDIDAAVARTLDGAQAAGQYTLAICMDYFIIERVPTHGEKQVVSSAHISSAHVGPDF